MSDTIANPIDVYQAIAEDGNWEYHRKENALFLSAELKNDTSRDALTQILWFPDDAVLVCVAIWPYENIEADDLQMHRAAASINEEYWQGAVYWHEGRRCMVHRMARELPDGIISEEAAHELHDACLYGMDQFVSVFESYRTANPDHTAMLMDLKPSGSAQ